MTSPGYEISFNGIVGPTHNYSGLSFGNIASMSNQNTPSNPKEAALQGLEKMKFLHNLGVQQGVIPPHERPHIPTLRALGFTGTDRSIPEKAYNVNPIFLFQYSSASPMWVANAATFTPSIDSADGKVHITPANLASTPHRSIEARETAKLLKAIFPSFAFFAHHPPLPFNQSFLDEGAANHTRFCKDYHDSGIHFFVYGISSFEEWGSKPQKFPARQTLEASEAIARSHKIYQDRVLFAQQNPLAIDAGAFHNDVIAIGNRNFLFYHEKAFLDPVEVINQIRLKVSKHCETDMHVLEVPENKISLKTAIETYLLNSELITLPDKAYSLIAPLECRINRNVYEYLDKLSKDPDVPLRDIHFVNTTESMRNGGGPACLRTRVVLNQNEINAANQKCLFDEKLYKKLKIWIEKHYRDYLTPKDLQDPNLIDEVQAALHELTIILDLGNIYSFQA